MKRNGVWLLHTTNSSCICHELLIHMSRTPDSCVAHWSVAHPCDQLLMHMSGTIHDVQRNGAGLIHMSRTPHSHTMHSSFMCHHLYMMCNATERMTHSRFMNSSFTCHELLIQCYHLSIMCSATDRICIL